MALQRETPDYHSVLYSSGFILIVCENEEIQWVMRAERNTLID